MPPLPTRAALEALLRADGFGHTLPPRMLLERPARDRLPTGISDLDARLGGGVPAGALSELIGPPSSGRTGVVDSLLVETTVGGELVAYLDAADTFDPWSADRLGVELSRLLWVRSGRVETAFKAADLIARAGGFRVIVLDLGDVPVGRLRRIPWRAYVRLRQAVERTPTALVLAADHPVAGTAAAVRVSFDRSRALWSGRLAVSRLLKGIRSDSVVVRGCGGVPATAEGGPPARSLTDRLRSAAQGG